MTRMLLNSIKSSNLNSDLRNSLIFIYHKEQMQSDQSKNNQRDAEKKKARRTRKDEVGRDYVCSCGKSYLSYPALYTHIKTKHDGKINIPGRQMPQKLVEDEEKIVIKEDVQPLKNLLSKYYPERLRATPIDQLSQFLSDEEKEYIIPLLQHWENEQRNQKSASEKKVYPSARQAFGKFVYDMNKRTNPACIKFLTKLMMLIHNGVCKEKKNDKYCDQCTASLVPNLFNELIMNAHIPIDKDSSQKIFQEQEVVCKIMVYFCNWMFNQKFTNYSVKFKL